MTALKLVLLIPFLGAVALALARNARRAAWLNIVFSALTFADSVWLAVYYVTHGPVLGRNKLLYVDALSIYLVVLTAFVGLTTAWFSRDYMLREAAHGRVGARRLRMYHAMFQGFLFAMLLALTANNLGLLWVAMEAATLSTVLLVSLYRTPESVEAAWKYFILCGVGIAQALFGTVLIFFAAARVVQDRDDALLWSILHGNAGQLEPVVLVMAFVFILVGYGTKVGLVPLHNWLPDAHSEGPSPMSAMLSGLLLSVALYAVVRIKILVDGSLAAHTSHFDPHLAGHLMMGFGLLSFLVAALFLHRQRDIKRLYSYSSIEHMGLMTFAFGLGGPLATFAALLHLAAHALTKSALFVTVGYATQIAGTQDMDSIRGLIRTQPTVGWGLMLGTAAIAGFPPFGLFMSEFMLLAATMHSWPWLSPVLLIGLVTAFAGLFRYLHPMVYGTPPEGREPLPVTLWPVMVHLLLVLWLGLAIPALLAGWFDRATRLITGGHLL